MTDIEHFNITQSTVGGAGILIYYSMNARDSQAQNDQNLEIDGKFLQVMLLWRFNVKLVPDKHPR